MSKESYTTKGQTRDSLYVERPLVKLDARKFAGKSVAASNRELAELEVARTIGHGR